MLLAFPAYTRETLLAADMQGLRRIIDYRNARAGLDLFNSGQDGAMALRDQPHLLDLLLEMAQAQSPDVTQEALLYDLEQRRPKEDN